jgi:hypothetical protein
MKLYYYSLIFTICSILFSCKKEPDDSNKRICNPSGDGSIAATINSQSWSACNFKAVYYTKAKILTIKAIDSKSQFELRFFITIDSITPLKTYTINTTSNNGLEVVESISNGNSSGSDIYFFDLVKPGIGGSITITKLDTITGNLSASFVVTGYSKEQAANITLGNGVITDVKLVNSTYTYISTSSISATINGIDWYSNQVFAKVNGYIGSPQYSFLEVRAMGYCDDLGQCPQYLDSYSRSPFWGNGRNFTFNIPLYLGIGRYPLESTKAYDPNSPHYLVNYNHHDFENRYYPTSGSFINIISIDTLNKSINATFNTQLKDSTGFSFTTLAGKIHINGWFPFN